MLKELITRLFRRGSILTDLEERQLVYLAKRFREWKSKYYPRLSDKDALEIYPGIETRELLENVR